MFFILTERQGHSLKGCILLQKDFVSWLLFRKLKLPLPVISESGTYTVYHLKQNILGSLKPGDCTRDIQRHLQQVYGVEVSPETISNITESVMADVREWQNRPLEKS